jgi:hypothetical protein
MNDGEIYESFAVPLWSDISHSEQFPARRPLLAHYTSLATLEKIMSSDELWFSHPLYMNDMEELRFGILEGAQSFRAHQALKDACGNLPRYELLRNAFEGSLSEYLNVHAIDTYVFCMSMHEAANSDGLLSMWRGYGGNGTGAAIVFDTTKINAREDTPIIVAPVTYATQDQRRQWIQLKLGELAAALRQHAVDDDKLYLPVVAFLDRLKMFALFSKHCGFSEEREWRVVYMRDRDKGKALDRMLDYATGRNGIEPKLKFKVAPIAGLTVDDLSIEKLITQIILGPSVSTPLAVNAVKRMLTKLGKAQLAEKVIASTTPFRPI